MACSRASGARHGDRPLDDLARDDREPRRAHEARLARLPGVGRSGPGGVGHADGDGGRRARALRPAEADPRRSCREPDPDGTAGGRAGDQGRQPGDRRRHLHRRGRGAGDDPRRRPRCADGRVCAQGRRGGQHHPPDASSSRWRTSDFEPPRSRAKQLTKDMHSVAAFSAGHGLELPVHRDGHPPVRRLRRAGRRRRPTARRSRGST